MKSKIPQISEAEWQVMKVLWRSPGLSAAQVCREILKENNWSDGTTRTYLRRLIDKGAIRYEQDKNDSRIYYYFPVISEEHALKHKSKSFLDRIIKGKAGLALAFMIKDLDLTNEEINKLENLLQKKKEGGK